jgi:hypothetical protein
MSDSSIWKKIGAGILLVGYGLLKLSKPGALPDIKKDISPQEINVIQGDTSTYNLRGSNDRMPINKKQCQYVIEGTTEDKTKEIIYKGYGDQKSKTFYLKNIKYSSPDTSFYRKINGDPKTSQEQIWQKQYEKLVNEYISAKENK